MVLYCIVFHCFVLFCGALYDAVVCGVVLYCVAVFCVSYDRILSCLAQCVILDWIVSDFVGLGSWLVVQRILLHGGVLCCIPLYCVVLCCVELRC